MDRVIFTLDHESREAIKTIILVNLQREGRILSQSAAVREALQARANELQRRKAESTKQPQQEPALAS